MPVESGKDTMGTPLCSPAVEIPWPVCESGDLSTVSIPGEAAEVGTASTFMQCSDQMEGKTTLSLGRSKGIIAAVSYSWEGLIKAASSALYVTWTCNDEGSSSISIPAILLRGCRLL